MQNRLYLYRLFGTMERRKLVDKQKIFTCMKQLTIILIIGCMVFMMMPVPANAACSHSSLGPRYSDATHPHRYYKVCNSCGSKVYIGGQEVKKHGPGTWGSGTCKSCGTHSYTGGTPAASHPHASVAKCACGETKTVYVLKFSCTQCRANSKRASNSSDISAVFLNLDGDLGIGTLQSVPVKFRVSYTNTYNQPNKFAGNFFPATAFSSWDTQVSCTTVSVPSGFSVGTAPALSVSYYNSSNGKLADQGIKWSTNTSYASSFQTTFFMLKSMPSYAIATGVCNLGSHSKSGTVKTYFT